MAAHFTWTVAGITCFSMPYLPECAYGAARPILMRKLSSRSKTRSVASMTKPMGRLDRPDFLYSTTEVVLQLLPAI